MLIAIKLVFEQAYMIFLKFLYVNEEFLSCQSNILATILCVWGNKKIKSNRNMDRAAGSTWYNNL